jgi:hypothetical protein
MVHILQDVMYELTDEGDSRSAEKDHICNKVVWLDNRVMGAHLCFLLVMGRLIKT